MPGQLSTANLNNILLIVLLIQVMVLAARFAAWRQSVRHDEQATDDEQIRPAPAGGSLVAVLTSAYNTLVLFGGLLVNRAQMLTPVSLVTALVVLILPALVVDGVLALRRARH